jgi:hypothetical protein
MAYKVAQKEFYNMGYVSTKFTNKPLTYTVCSLEIEAIHCKCVKF